MLALPKNLEQTIRILKWLNGHLTIGETSLQYLEEKMHSEYSQPDWDQTELNALRVTMYCTVNSMFIWFSSFESEYKGGFKAEALRYNRDEYIALNRNCTPYFKAVEEIFPNLNKIRNTILAHGYRWKPNTFLDDVTINEFMNEVTDRRSLHPYYQLSNVAKLVISEIEKVYGEVNAELNVDEIENDLD